MKPTVLVVTTVHHPDDTRIRERLIRSLIPRFDVSYATRPPGPTTTEQVNWLELRGSRFRRNVRASALLIRGDWDVAVIHDPELIPLAAMARLWRRRPVVFDVHEDLVAQIEAKEWIPRPLKPAARLTGRLLFWLAERSLVLTLAEEGYSRLFRREHPTFPNYPSAMSWPPLSPRGDGSVIYVGDLQQARGIADAVEAAGLAGLRMVLVGSASPEAIDSYRTKARRSGCDLTYLGRLSNPEALACVSKASVGLSPLRAMPNYMYSLPTKIIEYLAVGIPVVATDLPGTRRVLAGLEGVALVEPGDTRSLAKAMKEALEPGVRERTAEQAPLVRERFQWPDESVVSFYESLLTM